jgi:multidrug efflux pump subunit AcrA (membrane-fusion protein)
MKKWILFSACIFCFIACRKKVATIFPVVQDITESVYAPGVIKAMSQYQVYATVSGIISEVNVTEGDSVNVGTPLFVIDNQAPELQMRNAQLAADFNSLESNQDKLKELKLNMDLMKSKFLNDSSWYVRQQNLWAKGVGSQAELEQRQLAYMASRTNYESAVLKYQQLRKQIFFSSAQAATTAALSQKNLGDFIVRSELNGRVYDVLRKKGELVSPQLPLAVVGSANEFMLELQVDEYDIVKIKKGMRVWVTMDSYKNQVFEAEVSRINPIMNERTKTFLVEAFFTKKPEVLYPNLSVETNILLQVRKQVITLPRNVVDDKNRVILKSGDTITVETGLQDQQYIEILWGLEKNQEVIIPTP